MAKVNTGYLAVNHILSIRGLKFATFQLYTRDKTSSVDLWQMCGPICGRERTRPRLAPAPKPFLPHSGAVSNCVTFKSRSIVAAAAAGCMSRGMPTGADPCPEATCPQAPLLECDNRAKQQFYCVNLPDGQTLTQTDTQMDLLSSLPLTSTDAQTAAGAVAGGKGMV